MKKIEVAMLFDPSNNWIEKHVEQAPELSELEDRCNFGFFRDASAVCGFDIVFILGYTKILSKKFLISNKLNLIVHESDLPEGKGFSPVQWQILDKKNKIPICIIEAVEEVDSGDIFEKDFIDFSGYELFDEIREKQAKATLKLIMTFLLKYPDNARTKQKGEASFFRKRNHKDDELDSDKTIRAQFNHLRIANNQEYPLYFVIDGNKYFLRISKK